MNNALLQQRPASRLPLVCFISGLLGALVLAPVSLTALSWLLLIPLVIASNLPCAKQRLLCGYSFGLGYGIAILTWVPQTVASFSELGWGWSGFISLWFVVYSAIAPAIACWLPYSLCRSPAIRLLLILPLCWAGLMTLLVEVFIGVPNLTLAMAQVDGPLRGWIPVVGEWGVSVLVMMCNVLLLGIWRAGIGLGRSACVALLLLLFVASLGLSQWHWVTPQGAPLRVAMVQGNFDLSLQNEAAQRAQALLHYLELSKGLEDSDLILWPETALPMLNQQGSRAFSQWAESLSTAGSTLLAGTWEPTLDGRRYNSIRAFGFSNQQRYRKQLLVPFVEKTPFIALVGQTPEDLLVEGPAQPGLFDIGTRGITATTVKASNIRVTPLRAATLATSDIAAINSATTPTGMTRIGTTICWELLFRRLVNPAVEQGANLLVNLADDNWAEGGTMYWRNLQIARFRALETGRPVIRLATSGLSAVIDHKGQLQRQLPVRQALSRRVEVQPYQGLTPAVALGQSFFLLLSLVLIIILVRYDRRVWRWRIPNAAATSRRRSSGFTIIELITVIALVGILSAVVLPRFMDVSENAVQASFDQVRASFITSTEMIRVQSMSRGSAGNYPDVTLLD
ncbi:MAG: nitrilase-related carbon-nitrogen hydrolase [Motiliproteus sp.]